MKRFLFITATLLIGIGSFVGGMQIAKKVWPARLYMPAHTQGKDTPINAVEFWPFVTDQETAHHIALALAADPHVVLEIRPQGDGTFRAVLAVEVVEQVVLQELERK